MVTVLAPAKLNLTLEVLARKQNGFHEIRSVIQTIDLCDTLKFTVSRDVELKCDLPEWIPERSLVHKTVSRLRDDTGCADGVIIEVSKRIPLLSGLGGDSSDAAAALRGLNVLWHLELSPLELESYTRQLGSDATYFLYRGTALLQDRGEVVAPLPPLPPLWADKNHLIQMLTNLIDNALKYTHRGGQVWVAARELGSNSKRMLEIAVGDSGLGIPDDEFAELLQEGVFD